MVLHLAEVDAVVSVLSIYQASCEDKFAPGCLHFGIWICIEILTKVSTLAQKSFKNCKFVEI